MIRDKLSERKVDDPSILSEQSGFISVTDRSYYLF
jgi:hypothetical protein